jgi:hypothetical protein
LNWGILLGFRGETIIRSGEVHDPDAQTWIGLLRKEKNVVWALLRRKIRLDGPLKLLVAFGKCFPQ